MSENVIAVGITVLCDTISRLMKFFHRLTFLNSSQISLQTSIYISFLCAHTLVQCILVCLRLVSHDCRSIHEFDILDPLHLLHFAKCFRCIQRILRRCHKTMLHASHTSFDCIFPLFIRNIKQVRKDIYMDRSSILSTKYIL